MMQVAEWSSRAEERRETRPSRSLRKRAGPGESERIQSQKRIQRERMTERTRARSRTPRARIRIRRGPNPEGDRPINR